MNTVVKKKVAGKPIETLLKHSQEIVIDAAVIKESFAKLQELRQTYMLAPAKGTSVFTLPVQKKRKKA